MSWEPEVTELRRREELARRMGEPDRVERQREAGRLLVRERIDLLLDEGSFDEVGALAGFPTYDSDELVDFTPSNILAGLGRIDGRPVAVCADDFTVRGGAADGSIHAKQVFAERYANQMRVPIVRLIEGSGGGGSVRSYEGPKRTYVPANPGWDLVVDNLAKVPVVSACLGPVAGLGAARVVTSHFSVMVKGSSQLFVAGPPVVKAGMRREVTKEELGGWEIHAKASGAVDNAYDTEGEAIAACRRFLSYLPRSVWHAPPRTRPTDDPQRRSEELISIVPRERRQVYDMRHILDLVFDAGSVFEIGRHFGASTICALARLDGWPVAVMAEDPKVYAGGMTADAAEKITRFCDLAQTFHLPVVHLVDQPGFVIGVEAERAGTIRKGARALAAVYQATVPWVSVIVRKVFGVAGAAHGNAQRLNLRYAWPSGDWGSLPLEGGIEAAYRRQLEASDDPDALRAQILEEMESIRSPMRTAEAFGIERIIDPRDTRPILCAWAEQAHELVATDLGPSSHATRP